MDEEAIDRYSIIASQIVFGLNQLNYYQIQFAVGIICISLEYIYNNSSSMIGDALRPQSFSNIYLYFIPKTYYLNNYFIFQIIIAAADYQNALTKNREEGKPLHLGRERCVLVCVLVIIKNLMEIGLVIRWSNFITKILIFLVLRREMTNLLEMLSQPYRVW